jgi:hypothetical protein
MRSTIGAEVAGRAAEACFGAKLCVIRYGV